MENTHFTSFITFEILNLGKILMNRIAGVMVSVLASSAIDRGIEPRSGQTKYYKIGI